MLLSFLPRKTLRQRPRFQYAFHLQPKIVVQSPGCMFLNDKPRGAADHFRQRLSAFRFRRFPKIAFRFVGSESHLFSLIGKPGARNRKNATAIRETAVAPTLSAILRTKVRKKETGLVAGVRVFF
jgi:hypothetical protein